MRQIIVLKQKIIQEITEPRRVSHGHVLHELVDILVIALCTILCGGESFADMEDFGRYRYDWLKTFLHLPNGIPDSDTFRRCLERICPKELSRCLYDWLGQYRKERGVLAIDGKTIRGSANADHKAYHVLSCFATEFRITLGEVAVDEKSNEITAVPELLDLLDVSGSIVTADAMSCQKSIVQKITEKRADYVIGLKGNQKTLHEDVRLYMDSYRDEVPVFEEESKGHGRKERRIYRLLTDIQWLEQRDEWSGLSAVGEVERIITQKGTTRTEMSYYITSLTAREEFSRAVRNHWKIENNLHWSLDVLFREDDCRAKKDNSPKNLNVLRKVAFGMLETTSIQKKSKRRKKFIAALDHSVMEHMLLGAAEIQ